MTLLLLGWLLPQLLLHGSVLTGARLALPLDCLALPNYYLPRTAEYSQVVPADAVLTDLILQYPFNREFAAREIRAGRFPHWNPYRLCRAPFLYPIFSPFEWLYFLVPLPATLAWIQLLHALTLAGGVYAFARKSLGLSFWAALAGSCCAPWCGYMVLWQGFPMTAPVALFPWLLTAVERTVRMPGGAAPPCLAALTAVHLLSGGFDVGCQVLLATGLYAVFVICDRYLRVRQWRSGIHAAAAFGSAWLLGFLLAAPALLPFFDYVRTRAASSASARLRRTTASRFARVAGDRAAGRSTVAVGRRCPESARSFSWKAPRRPMQGCWRQCSWRPWLSWIVRAGEKTGSGASWPSWDVRGA